MLPDVGMVQMYSKSTKFNVNDLGFAWTGWPPFLHGPALLLAPTVFSARWFAMPLRHTAPSLHLPLFLEETFLHTLVSRLFMECKLHMGNGRST